MRLVSSAEMREIDRLGVERFHLPEAVLMENAGREVAELAAEILGGAAGQRVLVLAYTGHNGGDGLVAARYLAEAGAMVTALQYGDPDRRRELVATQERILTAMGRPPVAGEAFDLGALGEADLVIDALLGTGSQGAPQGELERVIRAVNAAGRPVLAVDLPSGVDADDGRVPGVAIRAVATATLAFAKAGLFLSPGREHAGRVKVVPIGLPAAAAALVPETGRRTSLGEAAGWRPPREAGAHKGRHGSLLLVAGSRGMMGAAIMAARGALRSGVGLVHLVVPEAERASVVAAIPEVITHGWSEERGAFGPAAEMLTELLPKFHAVAIGPGLGRGQGARGMLELLWESERMLLVDADGLNLLAESALNLKRPHPTLLTPHPGEMARLLGRTSARIDAERWSVAREAADLWGLAVLLKGAPTVLAAPGEVTRLNPTGGPVLAVGGTGDVLTGLAGGLMAQGLSPYLAGALGAFLHGRAADLWQGRVADRGLLAGQVADLLPEAWADLGRGLRDDSSSDLG